MYPTLKNPSEEWLNATTPSIVAGQERRQRDAQRSTLKAQQVTNDKQKSTIDDQRLTADKQRLTFNDEPL
jgi:hypothetical protein